MRWPWKRTGADRSGERSASSPPDELATDHTIFAGLAGRALGSDSDRRNSSVDATRRTIEQQELAANVSRMRQVVAVAAPLWLLTGALDWSAVHFVVPGASLAYMWAVRGTALVGILALYARLHRKPLPGPRMFFVLDVGLFVGTSVTTALLCIVYQGLASPYAHAISCILVCRGIAVVDHWKRGAAMLGAASCAFPITLALAALFVPGLARQWHDPASLAVFTQNLGLIFVTWALLTVGGHASWSLRRQVFEARNVGRYRLKRLIGRGGMGEVWQARHPALERDVAMKILRGNEAEPNAIARFEREVRATTQLLHPNTVRVFDCGVTDDGLWFFTMELLEGETLGSLVDRSGPLSAARAVHLVRQATRAIAEAHDHGIVHRDLKPENIFVTTMGGEKDFVKVLDFGIAKVQPLAHALETAKASLTGTGTVLGTPAFMSPEQASGVPAGRASDLYSLGAVLYFALTGRAPFASESLVGLVVAHMMETPSPPSQHAVEPLPPALDAVVMYCLRKNPEDRYASAAEFDAALAEAMDSDEVVPPLAV